MLSILIPANNRPVLSTARQVLAQAAVLDVDWEILTADRGGEAWAEVNTEVGYLEGVSHLTCDEPRSAAATRNALAQRAKYPHSLFVDGDCDIIDLHFIERFLSARDAGDIVCGGVQYPTDTEDGRLLHLAYNAAHAKDFAGMPSANNFLSSTWLIRQVKFHEEDDLFGYRDLLLKRRLEERKVSYATADNPVMPSTFEEKDVFLQRMYESIETLWDMTKSGALSPEAVPLIAEYHSMKNNVLGRAALRSYAVGQKALWLAYKQGKAPVKTVDRLLLLRLSELDPVS